VGALWPQNSLYSAFGFAVLGGHVISLLCASDCTVSSFAVATGKQMTLATLPGSPYWMGSSSTRLFWTIPQSDGSQMLWSTNGSTAGTEELVHLPPASITDTSLPFILDYDDNWLWPSLTAGVLEDTLYFGWNGVLWSSDGTPAGTTPLATVSSGVISNVVGFPPAHTVLVASTAQTGIQLDSYDPATGAVTLLEQSALTGLSGIWTGAPWLAAAGNHILFNGFGPRDTQQLVSTDGTDHAVLSSGPDDYLPEWLTLGEDGPRAYLSSLTSSEAGVWASDGTIAGTTQLDKGHAATSATDNGTLYYMSGSSVWRVTPQSLTPEAIGSAVPNAFLFADSGRVFLFGPFTTNDWWGDTDLYEITSAGTSLVADQGTVTNGQVMVLGDLVFVNAVNWDNGGPTGAITAIDTGTFIPLSWPGLSSQSDETSLVKVSNTRALAWVGNDLTILDVAGKEVQPTAVSNISLASNAGGLALMNGDAYFAAVDEAHGTELFRLRADSVVPELVADINPGAESSSPSDLYAVTPHGPILFSAYDNAHGTEMWVTSGTAGTTTLVQDIDPGPDSSGPLNFQVAGDTVFFSANDGVHGRELWKMPVSAVETPVVAQAPDAGQPADAGQTGAAGQSEDAGPPVRPWRLSGGCASSGPDLAALLSMLLLVQRRRLRRASGSQHGRESMRRL
jgi:ELWxxDGT repeat protein